MAKSILKSKQEVTLAIKQLELLKFDKGQRYRFEATKIIKRSHNENNYMWFVNAFYGDFLGYTPDEMHYDILSKLRTIEKEGNDGRTRKVVLKTSEMSHNKHSDYMARIRFIASKHHEFFIPKPNQVPDEYYEKYNKNYIPKMQ